MKSDAVRVEASLREMASLVNTEIERVLAAKDGIPARLREAMRYPLDAGGKRLRAGLVLSTSRALGADDALALPGAVAVELIHCYSLVHDDLPCMDDDDLRRGQPTVHKVYGDAMAVLVGDALQALAFEVLLAGPAPLAGAVTAARVLARAAGSSGMVGGQVMDLDAEGAIASPDLVREIHLRKTAALIAASCEIGASLAGADRELCTSIRHYGQKLGLAFQIVDDCLDETATAEELGKSPGKDAKAGKMTWPACVGLEASKQAARELVLAAQGELNSLKSMDLGASFLQDLASFVVERRL